MNMVEFKFTNQKTGERVHEYQAENTEAAFEGANKKAQQLANKHQSAIAVTAWLEDREGATTYRYPTGKNPRGRPTKPDAMTNAQRQAAFRNRKQQQGICPCCGQEIKR